MSKESDARIVIVGAGSQSFGLGTIGDLMCMEGALKGATVVLHDKSEEMLKLVGGVFKKALDESAEDDGTPTFKMEMSTDPRKSLQDANYVVMTIENGSRLAGWEQDYYVPLKYGCKQVYGENGGPGGAFHTWRQVPPMLDICHIMEDVCPDALLLNYSNPVPRVTWAITRATKIKTVGLCHGIHSGMSVLGQLTGAGTKDLDFISAGLNHFYFFIKCSNKVPIMLPAIGKYPAKKVPAGTDLIPYIKERGIEYCEEHELTFIKELFQVYGYLTYPDQSHPAEYIHWSNAYVPFVKYGFRGSNEPFKKKMKDTLDGKTDNYWWVHWTNERAVHIIDAMEHNTGAYEVSINIPNKGSISNLPDDCVVEVPATVDKKGIHPLKLGKLPRGIANILLNEANLQDLVVEAAITGDYTTALQALSMDATVPSPQVARKLLDEMLETQKDFLPQFHKKK
jgi:alpha-galactosidase